MHLNWPLGRKEPDMGRRQLSLWDFLEQHLTRRENDAHLALLREQLDKSELLVMMERIANEVNKKARELVIDVQSYFPPEPLVRSFSFRKGHKDYILQVESWEPNPTLVFLMWKWRGPLFLSPFGWICRLFGVEEYVMDVKFRSPLRVEEVTEAEVEKWFIYLISGFDRVSVPIRFGPRRFLTQAPRRTAETDWQSSISSDRSAPGTHLP
jgi:hypothetical protein